MHALVALRPARRLSLRLLALVLALVVAGGLASASNLKAVKAEGELELTYSKWFISNTAMAGVVGGDIEGTFAGALLSPVTISKGFYLLNARYEIIANDPSLSFTADVEGRQNIATGVARLHGIVTSGFLTGAHVRVRFQAFNGRCPGVPQSGHPCFQGSIRVLGDSEDNHS